MPENQTAWNSNNQGIKETVNQPNQTGKTGGNREPSVRLGTVQAGLAEGESETQSRQWTMAGFATVGETPSLT